MKYLLSISLIFLIFPFSVSAKDLSFQSGFIKATLTIKPDEIVAGEGVGIFLEFKDGSGLFSLKRCDCRIKIQNQNKEDVLNLKLQQNEQYVDDRIKEIPYIFKDTGIYTIIISGVSVNKVFPTFSMSEKLEISLKHKTEGEKRFESLKETLVSLVIPLAIVLIIAGIASRFLIKKK